MDDVIYRQDTIDAIVKRLGIKDESFLTEQEKTIVKVLRGMPSAQKWIPCSERLPEEDGQYLITVKYVHVDGYDDIYAEHGEWMKGKWDMFCFGHCGQVETILAWMPLPEPWKGEEDGLDRCQ